MDKLVLPCHHLHGFATSLDKLLLQVFLQCHDLQWQKLQDQLQPCQASGWNMIEQSSLYALWTLERHYFLATQYFFTKIDKDRMYCDVVFVCMHILYIFGAVWKCLVTIRSKAAYNKFVLESPCGLMLYHSTSHIAQALKATYKDTKTKAYEAVECWKTGRRGDQDLVWNLKVILKESQPGKIWRANLATPVTPS